MLGWLAGREEVIGKYYFLFLENTGGCQGHGKKNNIQKGQKWGENRTKKVLLLLPLSLGSLLTALNILLGLRE